MDEIAASPPARLSALEARPRRGERAAWTGAWVLAAAHLVLLMVVVPAGGAAVCGLATLLSRRRPSAAERARTMSGGAFLASLMLTIGGVAWVISHAQLTG